MRSIRHAGYRQSPIRSARIQTRIRPTAIRRPASTLSLSYAISCTTFVPYLCKTPKWSTNINLYAPKHTIQHVRRRCRKPRSKHRPQPIQALRPSPVRSLGLGIFTCDDAPPAIPAAYTISSRISTLLPPPPIFYPSASLSRPLRLSAISPSSAFAPSSPEAQYSASAWRAIHPKAPAPSRSHLPTAAASSFHHRYSHSSVSLTRPHRLSGTPALSSRSDSTGPENAMRDETPDTRISPSKITFAVPRKPLSNAVELEKGQIRTASAPDTSSGAQQDGRMNKEKSSRVFIEN